MIRFLIIFGLIMIIIGIAYPQLQELGLGNIPGDFCLARGDFEFYFPITSSIIVSFLINLILWFCNKD